MEINSANNAMSFELDLPQLSLSMRRHPDPTPDFSLAPDQGKWAWTPDPQTWGDKCV